ncbi:sialate O-acetylesterase [Ginsengibacter hankyongi]|uniref:Sialate O-acetylesterase n=1 Tax=Ginsengibacter hankyongi TaxID=2607284 RepID=A0A5J5ICH5_9BACT|nr:sialate O-acetylesterase [Ginsengibacter hankyongi]KAA9035669.1 sialate O-acetylesterase [Ginsengibacter hankyongi]
MRFIRKIFTVGVCLIATHYASAQVKLPQLIRDSMILQRDAKINLWGWASNGEKISVKFNGKKYKTRTDDNGRWSLQLSSMKAGGPYTMEISGKNKITLHNILVGDVWLCTGQSNMVHQMILHGIRYADEIANANNPEIRQFWVPNVTNLQGPQKDLPGGSWKWANPNDIKEFSAVAYFFAKALYQKYHVPIGIINASWGGVPIESMMSEESFKDLPSILSTIEKNKDTAYVNGANRKAFAAMSSMPHPEDKGMTEKWFEPSYTPKEWHRIAIPGFWEDQGAKNLNGVVWYRREIDVPASMTNVPAKVFLGRIVDADELYINGKKVGTTGYMYPQRRYPVPGGVLKPGKNLFVVRVTNNFGKGGFVPDKPYQLIAGNDTIDLTGYWEYKAGRVNFPRRGFGSFGIAAQNQPTALYNSMIAPLVGYTIKGFVWYQGESNTGKPGDYAKRQPAMITDWRNKWKEGDIPFLFVQLPGFGDYNYLPSESQWATFREAQAKSLSVSNTAMAVAIDVGEWNDIHPDHKKEVGDRLALAAEKIAYGENIVYAGPIYKTSTIDGNKIIISFNETGSGLTTNDGEAPAEFAIAGDDKKFVWANAKIEGDKVIVWSDDVPSPKYVRYAWADEPINPNLINKEGLPAAPFRTDE